MFEKYLHQRNYACRIKEYTYNGLRVLTMENEFIKVSILVDKGTDIHEFIYKPKDIDFMWHSFNGIRDHNHSIVTKEHPGGAFLDNYEGGWQELFPNIGEPCSYMGADLGTHGEVCLLPWEYKIEYDTLDQISVKFWVRTIRTPYLLEKTYTIKRYDPVLYIDEQVTNEGTTEMQFAWGHHPAVGPMFLDDSCIIHIDGNCKIKTTDISMVLPKNSEFPWPRAQDINGQMRDLSKVLHPDEKTYMEYAVTDLAKGWYSIENTSLQVGFGMEWDKDLFPYIWIWAPNCGQDGYPWYGRSYTLALEPWSTIHANLERAIQHNEGIKILPGQTMKTQLKAFAIDYTKKLKP